MKRMRLAGLQNARCRNLSQPRRKVGCDAGTHAAKGFSQPPNLRNLLRAHTGGAGAGA